MATDNYHGFKYQTDQWDPAKEGLREDYDPTRRAYFG